MFFGDNYGDVASLQLPVPFNDSRVPGKCLVLIHIKYVCTQPLDFSLIISTAYLVSAEEQLSLPLASLSLSLVLKISSLIIIIIYYFFNIFPGF